MLSFLQTGGREVNLPSGVGLHHDRSPVTTSKTQCFEVSRLATVCMVLAYVDAGCVAAGVAFHHAGLGMAERNTIEQGYFNGDINVICCTSTLAAGVNLPCHFVIIKNTVGYQGDGCKEYSDLDVMQMLGRAGRSQFDTSAVAVIMTRQDKVGRYEKMVSGQEILESRLHLNLIEHLVC